MGGIVEVNDNSIQNRGLDMWTLRRPEIDPVSDVSNTEFLTTTKSILYSN